MSTEGISLIYSANGTVIGANYYAYTPSAPAGYTFVALFAGASIAHAVIMFPYRAAFFIPLIVGGIMETFGYYGRAWASSDPHNFGAWALQAFLIICAPPMLSATAYMSLGSTIRMLDGRQNALMSPRATTPLFVIGDLVAFFSQLAGIGFQAARSASLNATGKNVVLGGLILQLFLFAFFIANIAVFHRRNVQHPTLLSGHPQVPRWERRMYTLYVSSGCILLRNFVRVVEYAEGPKSSIATHEVYVYIFDALLIWLAMMAFFFGHPGRLMKGAKRVVKGLMDMEDGTIPMSMQGRDQADMRGA